MIKGQFLNLEFLEDITYPEKMIYKQKGHNRLHYYNIPVTYDIETSSFRDERDRKTSITYSHALNIDGYCFKMETWDQLTNSLDVVVRTAGLDLKHRMIIYVHNLSYEFQFMKKHFNFQEVFSNGKERKILYALTTDGIEFRCSMMLSGSSLAGVAKNLTKYKIAKMEGDLDYDLPRHPETPLTKEEMGYILNDVIIIEYFIRESIDEVGTIAELPLTNTGYVRNFVRNACLNGIDQKHLNYQALMAQLTLEPEEYQAARAAFAGGFTHANIAKVNETIYEVWARDFASHYPARMIAYQYPMSKGIEHTVSSEEDFIDSLENYACLFYIRLDYVVTKANESYISISKTIDNKNVTTNNGRIETAEFIEMWVTEVDFAAIQLSYEYDSLTVGKMWRYKLGYLPKPIIESILKLYKDKTTLKDVKGSEAEYTRSKGMLNSTYGMCVQDIVQDNFDWNDIWKESQKNEPDFNKTISKNNKSRKRFLFYPWGVWITAYARFDLFREIVALGDDYVYADTDSVYYLNEEKNQPIFDESNERITNLLHKAVDFHGIDREELRPKAPNGNPTMLGVWEFDGHYKRFKTLGAKRYMVEKQDGKINITVSGVNKNYAVPYMKKMCEKNNTDMFDIFADGLVIPKGKSGKKTLTYIDAHREGTIIDYKGTPYNYEELSGIHMEDAKYNLSISDEFKEAIEWIKQR